METQNTTTSNGVNNSHTKDNAAKIVFGDPVLCAQFLKGYTDIPLFKEIKPEDIENVSSHFLPLFQESRDSDTVSKIRIGDSEIYLIALIEHQSENDFDMSFRILRYIVFIWTDYLLKIIGKVIAVLLHKLNIPDEEVYEVTDQITRRKFSMMFDNFQAYDVQETRRVSREEGRLEGRIEGERTGRIEGEQLHLIKLVIKKIEKQCSAAQISEILEEPLDIIQQIYNIALCQAPDYNADKILKELNSKTVS